MERVLLLAAILLASAVSHAQGYMDGALGLSEAGALAGAFGAARGGTGQPVQTPSVFKGVSDDTFQRAKNNAFRSGTHALATDPNGNQVQVAIAGVAGHYLGDRCLRYVATIVASTLPPTKGIICKSAYSIAVYEPDPSKVK